MATIQNERDKLLQAASVRFILPDIDPGRIPGLDEAINNANNANEASKNLRIRATSAVFKVGLGGMTTPTSILLEAILSSNLSGTVTWSVTNGTATLTGTGNSRTLTPANMISFTATIRATLVSGSRTFYDEWTITKVEDGAAGPSGADADMSFKSTAFIRSNTTPSQPTGGTFAIPIPTGWSDGVPAGEAKLWATTRIFTATGTPPQQTAWTTPHAMTDTADFEVKYSSVATSPGDPTSHPSNWSDTANVFTVWMATRTQKNGTWSNWTTVKVKGETGDKGDQGTEGKSSFKSTAFSRTNGTPAPPTGGSYASPTPTTSTWSDGVPAGDAKLWASTRIFSSDGGPPQQGAWTTPQPMTDTASFEAMYSTLATSPGNPTTQPTNWTANASTNTIWMATRTQRNGTWSAWGVSKVKGEQGPQGASGSNGAPGAAGSRGSGTAFGVLIGLVRQNRGSRAKWATGANSSAGDTAATNIMSSKFGLPLVQGDTVTLTNSSGSPTVSVTGYWNGAQWTDPGVIIDGNLLVSGDISGQTFTGGTFTGSEFIAKESGVISSLIITYGSTPNGTRLPKLEIFNHLNQKTTHISPGVNSFSSGNTQPAIDVYNDFAGTSDDAHGVRAEAKRGVGVSGRSAFNYGGFFATHSSTSAGVIALGDKSRNGASNILGDGIHARGGKYGGVFKGGYAPLRLEEGYSESALNGSLMFHNGSLWLKSNGSWKALAFN